MNSRIMRSFFSAILVCSLSLCDLYSQRVTHHFNGYVEGRALYSSGSTAPFWMIHNHRGTSLLSAKSLYTLGGLSYRFDFADGHDISVSLEGLYTSDRFPRVLIRQGGIRYNSPYGTIEGGALPYIHPLDYSPLSSGAMTLSGNTLPIPKILIKTPGFVSVPYTDGLVSGFLDFSVGRFFENQFLEDQIPQPLKGSYVNNVLFHSKAAYLRVGSVDAAFPLLFTIGGLHAAQWGGHRYGYDHPAPHSFKDFIRVVMGRSGGRNATISDQINALGNQFGHYVVQLDYYGSSLHTQFYHHHYFEDKSGIEWNNGMDGLWGLRLSPKQLPFLNDLVLEYLTTTNQSGPFHIIHFDRTHNSGRGGGNDGYYNNSEYRTGVTYYGLGFGNPLILSPLYNTIGIRGAFSHTRVQATHIGCSGWIVPNFKYQLKFSSLKSWGGYGRPLYSALSSQFLYAKLTHSLEVSSYHLNLFTEIGGDWGTLTPSTIGGAVGFKILY